MHIKAIEYPESWIDLLEAYKYQKGLTQRLDNLEGESFDQEIVNEIVLWKVNRYAGLSPELLSAIDSLAKVAVGEHRRSEPILHDLLCVKGVDLAMASTFFRFRNPHAFQIIDRHAYRAVYGEDLKIYATTAIAKKIEIYFDYLDALRELSLRGKIGFEDLDRMLYMFDKEKNGPL